MPGTVHDGHKFVDAAFAAGAAGAIVSQPVDGPHVLVDDTFAALQALGGASRERSRATIIGVTGSVGKTSTKEALFAALDRNRPGKVHRSVKSYNNHTGVPLSLARMPRDADYAVLEMGMNNKGEIAALTRQVRPHVALITAIAPAHIENLGSEEAIADAKAEIFEGLRARRGRHHPQRYPAPRPAGEGRAPQSRPDRHLRRRRCRRPCHPRGLGRRRRKPDQRRAARARADLHHLAARRALGVERARGPRRRRSGRRRCRAGRARACRPRRPERPRRTPPDPGRRRRSAADRRELQCQSRVDGRDLAAASARRKR